jgi:hypothetical protein
MPQVTALSPSPGQIDLFICGSDGGVYTSQSTNGGQTWIEWAHIGGVFSPGAPVTALSPSSGQIDLFICGSDGGVYTSQSTDRGRTWKQWTDIGRRGAPRLPP